MFNHEPISRKSVITELGKLNLTLEGLHQQSERLVNAFNKQFPPRRRYAYLTSNNPDGSLTAIRWRISARPHSRFELHGDIGCELQDKVGARVWERWLEFERVRVDLNLRISITAYTITRYKAWLKAKGQIQSM